MTDPSPTLTETLRGRLLRGVQAGSLRTGDRLPSARELVAEFDVDHRLILGAYRELADEGLVEIRERGGVYVAASEGGTASVPALPPKWVVDTFTDAFAREVGVSDLLEWLKRSVDTARLHAAVISSTEDQVAGLARELRDDFGLIATGIVATELSHVTGDPAALPAPVKRADVLLATSAHSDAVRRLAERLDKPFLAIEVRPDLVAGEWAVLLRQPVWAVVATTEFGEMLQRFFANVRGSENLHVLVHGQDDLSTIPHAAPTYVTARVRRALADTPIPGRILPPARTIAVASAREIFAYIVEANLRAHTALRATRGDAQR